MPPGVIWTKVFIQHLSENNITFEIIEWRHSIPMIISLNQKQIYIKYANPNKQGNWFLGFPANDIHKEGYCDYVLLLCYKEMILKFYLIPFNELRNFKRTGEPTNKRNGSPEYKTNIFPSRGYIFQVGSGEGAIFPMRLYEKYSGPLNPEAIQKVVQAI